MIGAMNALDQAIEYAQGVGRLAAAIGVGQSVISNWRKRGTLPEAVHCVSIERVTGGRVSRCALRPNDWQQIWPELVKPAGQEVDGAVAAIVPKAGPVASMGAGSCGLVR